MFPTLPQLPFPKLAPWSTSMKFWGLILLLAEIGRSVYSMMFYTEVDYLCYKDFGLRLLNEHDFDYGNYVCPQGPMYYPVGFAYTYAFLMFVTQGSLGLMMGLHACMQVACTMLAYVVFAPLLKGGHWAFVPLALFVQNAYATSISRVTNDIHQSFALLLMLFCMQRQKWWLVSLLYTFSVAYKMNGLLFGPGILFVYLTFLSFKSVFFHFLFMGIFQVVLPMPFLLHNPMNYLKIAFNFSRDFSTRNNVAWNFLSDELRYDPVFYKILLGFTVLGLVLLTVLLVRAVKALWKSKSKNENELSRKKMLVVMTAVVLCNFIGYTFSRGIHVQFFLWIYFTLAFLCIGVARIPPAISVAIILIIDWAHYYVASCFYLGRLREAFYAALDYDFETSFTLLRRVFHWLTRVNENEMHKYKEEELTRQNGLILTHGYDSDHWSSSWFLIGCELIIIVLAFAYLYSLGCSKPKRKSPAAKAKKKVVKK